MTTRSAMVATLALACPLAALVALVRSALRWSDTDPPAPPSPILWDGDPGPLDAGEDLDVYKVTPGPRPLPSSPGRHELAGFARTNLGFVAALCTCGHRTPPTSDQNAALQPLARHITESRPT